MSIEDLIIEKNMNEIKISIKKYRGLIKKQSGLLPETLAKEFVDKAEIFLEAFQAAVDNDAKKSVIQEWRGYNRLDMESYKQQLDPSDPPFRGLKLKVGMELKSYLLHITSSVESTAMCLGIEHSITSGTSRGKG